MQINKNKFTCMTPLIKNDISNNKSIDLSGYYYLQQHQQHMQQKPI